MILWLRQHPIVLAVFVAMAMTFLIILVLSNRGGSGEGETAAGSTDYLQELASDPTQAVQRLIGRRAYWVGYPLPRPEWCPSTRGAWTMAEIAPGTVIPACASKKTGDIVAFLGLWGTEGCERRSNGLSEDVAGVIEQPFSPVPEYSAWTECPPPAGEVSVEGAE